MNSNRNRYASAPTYGMQKRPHTKKPAAPQNHPQQQAQPAPVQPQQQQPAPYIPGFPPPAAPQMPNAPYGYQVPQQPAYPTPSAGGSQMNQPMMGYPAQMPEQPQGYMQSPYPPQPNPMQQTPPAPNPGPQQTRPKVQKPKRRDAWLQILMLAVLPVLFIVAMATKMTPLFWVFTGFALVGLAAMWLQSTFVSSARTTLSLIYSALLVVALVTIFSTSSVTRDNTHQPQTANNGAAIASLSGGVAADPLQADNYNYYTDPNLYNYGQAENYAVSYTPEPSMTSEAAAQLDSFMYLWNANKLDDMIALCAPSWSSGLDDARKALYAILANRIPVDYNMERITGTDADSSRTITMTATIDKQNNREPAKYRFQVLMLKENGAWYVDPQSLKSNEPMETATPAPTATPEPVATAAPSSKLKLYYNSDGGSYYHTTDTCSTINEKYYSKMKSFYYGDLDSSKFKKLDPCSKCGAPARP